MSVARVVVTIPNSLMDATGPVSSATLHFNVVNSAGVGVQSGPILDAVQDCWEALGNLYGVGASPTINARLYDLADPEPRVAMDLREFTIDPSDSSLPGECSANVHFRAARAVGVPAQRKRGTLQLGPLGGGCLVPATGRLSHDTIEQIGDAFDALAAAADPVFPWVVGSEAHGFSPVTVAYVNNEFGTVGSRQFAVTETRPIVLP